MTIEWRTRGRAHVLGDDIPHDGGVINFSFIPQRITDPEKIIPALFQEIDPTLIGRIAPGDFIVAGRNFLCGKAHNNGLIGMHALGLRVLCESMPYRSLRASVGVALPCLTQCEGVTRDVANGDEIEVDFEVGLLINHSRGGSRSQYPALSPAIKATLEQGGMKGLLANWLATHPELGVPLTAHVR